MGREWVTVLSKVTASVSRHNSDQDAEDDALVDELRHRLVAILEEDRYESIMPVW